MFPPALAVMTLGSRTLACATTAAIAISAFVPDAGAQGRVVAVHDEWFTYGSYFGASEQQFMTNALNWFGVTSSESVLLYTSNYFTANPTFTGYLTAKGISSTTNASAPAASFSSYAAMFITDNTLIDVAAVTAYINSGGNAMIIGGSGSGDASSNAVLANFGFAFVPYNTAGGFSTSAFASQGPFGAALFTDVSSVFGYGPNPIVLTAPVEGVATQLFSGDYGYGTLGMFGAAEVQSSPEPVGLALIATGFLALIPLARRKLRD